MEHERVRKSGVRSQKKKGEAARSHASTQARFRRKYLKLDWTTSSFLIGGFELYDGSDINSNFSVDFITPVLNSNKRRFVPRMSSHTGLDETFFKNLRSAARAVSAR